MRVILIKNIAVIIVNTTYGLVDQDKILDCIALDTSYKIHILVEDTNDDKLDGWDNLYDILDFIDETNNRRPVYVHYKYFHLMDSNFVRTLCFHGFRFDSSTILRVSNHIFKKNKNGYYVERIEPKQLPPKFSVNMLSHG